MNKLTNTLRATALTLATTFVAFASGCATNYSVNADVVRANEGKPLYVKVNSVLDGAKMNSDICKLPKDALLLTQFCNNPAIQNMNFASGLVYFSPRSDFRSGSIAVPKSETLNVGDIIKLEGPIVVSGGKAFIFKFVEVAARSNDKERAKTCYLDNGFYWKGVKCDGWDMFKEGAWFIDSWGVDRPTEAELKQRDAQKG